jgi:hypothetical protein
LGTLNVQNSTLSDNGFGVVGDTSHLTISGSTLTRNNVGLYSNRNLSVGVTNCTLSANSVWGAIVYANTSSGATATFTGSTVSNNAGGISVLNAETGDFDLVTTIVRDNSQSGLHLENCNMTINSQAENSWQTLRNQYGISSTGSTLVLDGLTIEDSLSCGLHSTSSAVTLSNSTVTGRDGVYTTGNSTLNVDACRLVSNVSGVANWGVYQAHGGLTVKNTLVSGFKSGAYLSSSNGNQSKVLNSTIVNVTDSAIEFAAGSGEVRNSILYSNLAASGINRVGGTLSHSHNLVHGFTAPFIGTVGSDTETVKKPRFIDAANGDYHLDKGSPAIPAGKDLAGNAVQHYDTSNTGVSRFGVI